MCYLFRVTYHVCFYRLNFFHWCHNHSLTISFISYDYGLILRMFCRLLYLFHAWLRKIHSPKEEKFYNTLSRCVECAYGVNYAGTTITIGYCRLVFLNQRTTRALFGPESNKAWISEHANMFKRYFAWNLHICS